MLICFREYNLESINRFETQNYFKNHYVYDPVENNNKKKNIKRMIWNE